MVAPYSTPCTATLFFPIIFSTASKNGGPASKPTFPDSVVPRAKMMVMAAQLVSEEEVLTLSVFARTAS